MFGNNDCRDKFLRATAGTAVTSLIGSDALPLHHAYRPVYDKSIAAKNSAILYCATIC